MPLRVSRRPAGWVQLPAPASVGPDLQVTGSAASSTQCIDHTRPTCSIQCICCIKCFCSMQQQPHHAITPTLCPAACWSGDPQLNTRYTLQPAGRSNPVQGLSLCLQHHSNPKPLQERAAAAHHPSTHTNADRTQGHRRSSAPCRLCAQPQTPAGTCARPCWSPPAPSTSASTRLRA